MTDSAESKITAAGTPDHSRIPKAVSYPVSFVFVIVLSACVFWLVRSAIDVLFTTGGDWMLDTIVPFISIGFSALYIFVFRPVPFCVFWKKFDLFGHLFTNLRNMLFVAAGISILLMIAGCPHSSLPPYDDRPVFTDRMKYELREGTGGFFEVSRVRYLMCGTGFHLAWHCGALGIAFGLLGQLCSGIPRGSEPEKSGNRTSQVS